MNLVRIWFSKTGAAVYMSHLDLMRYFTRALRRAALPVWYTEGFNPHPYLNFALPLPLGVSGLCECFDVRFTDEFPLDQAMERLAPTVTGGISVLSVTAPVHKTASLAFAETKIEPEGNCRSAIENFFARDRISVIKKVKNKKGKGFTESEIDVKPDIARLIIEGEDHPVIRMTLPASPSKTVSPGLIMSAFCETSGFDSRITRERLLLEDLEPFC